MKKVKKKNQFFKALIGVRKYAILTPLMMIGEVVMECLIPLIMAYFLTPINALKNWFFFLTFFIFFPPYSLTNLSTITKKLSSSSCVNLLCNFLSKS